MTRRLNRREAHRLALHYAIVERDSFVDAYSHMPDDPAAMRARWMANEFRRVLWEEFGEITYEDELAGRSSMTIFEMAKRQNEEE